MLPSVVPRLATDSAVRVFPGVWKLLSFLKRLPSRDGAPSLPLLSLFLSFIVFPTSFQRQWAAFLGAWCSLPAFRSCFVEFTQCLKNVLLMNLWGRKWSPHPIPPPSWDHLHNFFILSSVNGHLGCFHVLAIVRSVAMIDGIHVSFSTLVSSGYMPRSGITGSYGGFTPSFFTESPNHLP